MKMQFILTVKGEDTLGKKFEEAVNSNPNLHMDIIRSFGQTIMLAFRLNESDNISIDNFRAGQVPEEQEKVEKKVDE